MIRLLLILFFILPLTAAAQTPDDWHAFAQRINVKAYAGKLFKLQAAVKIQQIDPTAEAVLWVRVDRLNKKSGFFNNMTNNPIRVQQWQEFIINGKIDKDGEYLYLGGICYRSGVFFFDKFRLFVETSPKNFEEVSIPNGDFEAESLRPAWGYSEQSSAFVTGATTETSWSGNKSLKVDARQFKKPFAYGDNDSIGRYATVNGIRLYYEEYGNGEPLLLLHGNRQSINAFAHQIPELAKHYRVIAVDTRGQGKSTEDGQTYTYDLFASDINSFLNYLGLDSVNIVGWSDGGNTALIMAMKYPKKVKQLVTMGSNIFMNKSVVVKGVIPFINKQIKTLSADTSYKARNQARLLKMLLSEPNYRFDDLKIIQCPVLVIAGENDLIKAEHTKGIALGISKGTLLIAPNEKHEFPEDNATEFNRVVLNYLKGAD